MNIQTHAHTHSVHTPAHAHTPEHTHAHTLGHTLAHPCAYEGEDGVCLTVRPSGIGFSHVATPAPACTARTLFLGHDGQGRQGNRTGFTGQAWQALGMAGMGHSMGIVQAYRQVQAGIGTEIEQAFRLAQAGLIAGTITLPDRWCYRSLDG